jgi:cyclic pyranopterin phosphate synthase
MVDVGSKAPTSRRAVASALVRTSPETLDRIRSGDLRKGDAQAVARLAGIQGAKSTAALIPLCHPLPLDHVEVETRPEAEGVRIYAQASTRAATGVEMEALTGAAVAALALIDMIKSVERGVTVDELRIELKEGGKSGRWERDGYEDPWADGEDASPESE